MKKLMTVFCLVIFLVAPSTLLGQPFKLKFAHTNSDKDLTHQSCLLFAEKVKKNTEGRYEVEVYPNAVLGNDVKLLELEAMGAVDFVITGSAIYARHLKPMSLLMSPFMVETFEQGQRFYEESETVNEWFKQLEPKGFKTLATWERGFRCLNTKRPVRTPEDVKGVKLRLPPNPIHLAIWETLGAIPVAMGVKEVYMAIQQGVVEGQENPPVTTYGLKMHEVAPNITLTNHVYGPLTLSISTKTWKKITAKDQQAITKAAEESTVYNNKVIADEEEGIIKKMSQEGATIIKTNLKDWYAKVLPVYEKFKKEYGKETVEKLMKEAEVIKAKYPAK